jgi:hypothetical protein
LANLDSAIIYYFVSIMKTRVLATICVLVVAVFAWCQCEEIGNAVVESDSSSSTDKYLTWNIPGFTGYNNQLVLYVEMAIAAADLGRKLIPPGVYYHPILLDFTDVFDGSTPQLQAVVSPTQRLKDAPKHDVKTITAAQLFEQHSERIVCIDDPDGLWSFAYTRWLVTFHTRPSVLSTQLDLFAVRPDSRIAVAAHSIVRLFDLSNRAVAIHLRGDEWRVRCEGVLQWDPRKQYYGCYQERFVERFPERCFLRSNPSAC